VGVNNVAVNVLLGRGVGVRNLTLLGKASGLPTKKFVNAKLSNKAPMTTIRATVGFCFMSTKAI
jgi:hypothetical protein